MNKRKESMAVKAILFYDDRENKCLGVKEEFASKKKKVYPKGKHMF
jgi:hypothetical protein